MHLNSFISGFVAPSIYLLRCTYVMGVLLVLLDGEFKGVYDTHQDDIKQQLHERRLGRGLLFI